MKRSEFTEHLPRLATWVRRGIDIGFRISFRGPQTEKVNPMMDKASAAAEKVRAEFEAGFQEGAKSKDENND